MSFTLFEHNQQAYEAAMALLEETGKAAIVHPTGTGKSFIAFKLCIEHPEATVCWVSPSEYIFRTQCENIGEDVPDNIVFLTYAKLMIMTPEDISVINPDFIILDEFHRCGAEMWGQGVQTLLNLYPSVPVLGLSATAIRYLDNQRNMADELFDNVIASEITLGEAIVRGILNPPKYIISVLPYQKMLDKYEVRVRKAKNKAVRKQAEDYLESLRRSLQFAEGLDVIFDKHMEARHGKYIVFCVDLDHMNEMISLASEWFRKVDSEPHIYKAYSDDPETARQFAAFKNDDSDHLKLLYSIDMLNEGIHVDDVNGVILLRPTVSPIVYKQQIGRALSASKSCTPVIFDVVCNIDNLYSVDSLQEEMDNAVSFYGRNSEGDRIINETFEVIDEVRECRDLFDALNEKLTASWEIMYSYAEAYFKQFGNLEIPRRYSTEDGYSLGSWLFIQRKVYSKKCPGILTAEQIAKLDAIGMRWEAYSDMAWEKYIAICKKYYSEHGDLDIPAATTIDGIAIGRWLSQLRNSRNVGINRASLTEERIKELDSLGMIWNVPDYRWMKYYYAAIAYHKEHGNLDVPYRYTTTDGLKLGTWLDRMRDARISKAYTGQHLTDTQISLLDELGFVWNRKFVNAWYHNYEEAREYYKQNGNLNVPTHYKTASGFALWAWLTRQRSKEAALTKEQHALLDELGYVWSKDDPWLEKYELAKQYYDDHGNANLPANYVVNGIWLARWLSEQVLRLHGKRAGKKLTEEQTQLLAAIGVKVDETRHDILWKTHYDEAAAFYKAHGHLRVPRDYVDAGGYKLAPWILRQRGYYHSGKLTENEIRMLEEIGMDWDPQKKGIQG